jgi:hypothetical protein
MIEKIEDGGLINLILARTMAHFNKKGILTRLEWVQILEDSLRQTKSVERVKK